MLSFGMAIKHVREVDSLTQSEFVDRIVNNNSDFDGVDPGTVSRWENGVINPSHRRQIEIIKAAGFDLYTIAVDENEELVNINWSEYIYQSTMKYYLWDINLSKSNALEDVYISNEVFYDTQGDIFCHIFTDYKDLPIGQLTYKMLNAENFWTKIKSPNVKIKIKNNLESTCAIIDSFFCTSPFILFKILGIIMSKLLNGELKIIGFHTINKKSPIKKFLKTIGFKEHHNESKDYSLILTYHDALYSQFLFNCAIYYSIEFSKFKGRV